MTLATRGAIIEPTAMNPCVASTRLRRTAACGDYPTAGVSAGS